MKIIAPNNLQALNATNKVSEKETDEFQDKLSQKKENADVTVKLKNLLERIDIQAEKLSKRMSIEDLKEYKKLVSEFLNVTVNNSYKFSKDRYLDGKGRNRIFTVVKKVNAELENLTNEVLKSEKDRLGILGKIDDIRGMLVDVVA